MDKQYWISKYSDYTDYELEGISKSDGFQEAARVAAVEILKKRGIVLNPELQPEFLKKKNDLCYLLKRIEDYGFKVSFQNPLNYKITRNSSHKLTGLILIFLGVISLTIWLLPIINNYFIGGSFQPVGSVWVLSIFIGMIFTGWYRYFNAQGYKIEVLKNRFISELNSKNG
ncbi:hypothetical protein, partial [Xanthovirga aplysinae]|uniref:hypothetical protein n=1 Tax=Xanthovirga aplysinae TaxID=2529853 RepID=UPI0012BB6DED